MKTYKVYDINWDVDNEKERTFLPSVMRVPIFDDSVEDVNNREEIEEYISEYITEDTGYCHDGFRYKEITPNVLG